MSNYDHELDARGLNCPLPILRAKKTMAQMKSGQVRHIEATEPGLIRDFEARREQESKRPKLSPEDRQIMQQTGEELAVRMPDPGLKVGDRAPDFNLPNAFGESVSLYEQLKQGPVVLVFYRGAWCPYCNLQLHTLQQALPAFEREGAQLITVTPQKPDKSLEQVKEDGYPFEILSDLDSAVMKVYNLYFDVPIELADVYRRNFGLRLSRHYSGCK